MTYEIIRSRRRTVALEVTADGRVLVRASGTEPLIRVMLEGSEIGQIRELAYRIADVIAERLDGNYTK